MDNQTNHNPESYKPKHVAPKIKRRNTLTIVLFVLAFIMIGIGIWWVIVKRPAGKSTPQLASCTANPKFVEQSLAEINSSNIELVRDADGKIKNVKNYNSDINCLYMLTKSSIALGDADSATKYYNALKEKSSSVKLLPYIQQNSESIDGLNKKIDILIEVSKNFRQNTTVGPLTQ